MRSGLVFVEQGVSDFDEFIVGQLRWTPVPASGVLDESLVQGDVVPLNVVGEVRVPEPLAVGEQGQSADQLALRAEDVVKPGPGDGKDSPFTQVTREGLLVLVSFATYSSMKRGPVEPAMPELPEITDETA
ncbi:hypothetical protein ACWDUX_15740 [Streptomyces sp. NPDC003444]